MKKLLFASLIVLGTLTLPSCGGETKTEETTTTTTEETTPAETAPAETTPSNDTLTVAPADSVK